MKAINATPLPLAEIFNNSKNYIIPDYQRPYSWTADECTQLWEDLLSFYEDNKSNDYNTYFLGNIVYHTATDNKNNYHVIDGQQRLTSLLILLKILHEKAVNFSPLYKLIWKTEDNLEGKTCRKEPLTLNLYSNVLGGTDMKNFDIVMTDNEVSEDITSTHISNYFLLKNKITEWYQSNFNEYQNFVETIISKVIILPILCEDQDHALTIFETINNRGKSLSDADIFKAQIYKIALKNNEQNLFIEQWNQISEKTNSIVDIFRIYSHIIRGQKKDIEIEIGLRKFFTTKPLKNRAGLELSKQENWQRILDDLEKLSDCEKFLKNYAPDRIKKWWYTLTLVANTYTPYLLHTYLFYFLEKDKNDSIPILSPVLAKEFEKLCKACVKYFYGNRLCQITQTDMKHTIFQCIMKLTQNKDIEEIIVDLKKVTSNNLKEIEEHINNNEFDRLRTPLLHILAYNYDNQKFIIESSIEHILPKKWAHYEFTHWSPELVKENIERLGNVVLLEPHLNKYANNHIFSYKQEHAYKKSEFQICKEKELLAIKEWNLEAFYERDRKCKTILKEFFRS